MVPHWTFAVVLLLISLLLGDFLAAGSVYCGVSRMAICWDRSLCPDRYHYDGECGGYNEICCRPTRGPKWLMFGAGRQQL